MSFFFLLVTSFPSDFLILNLTISRPEYPSTYQASAEGQTALPHLTQLHQLKLTLPGPNPRALPTFLAQNRSTLKKICLSSATALPFSSSSSNSSAVTTSSSTNVAQAPPPSTHPFADLLLPSPPAPAPAPAPPPAPALVLTSSLATLLPLVQLTHISLRSSLASALDAFTGLLNLVSTSSSNSHATGGAPCAQLYSLRIACFVPGYRMNSSGGGGMGNINMTPAESAALNNCANALMALANRAQQQSSSSQPAFPALRHFGFRISPDYSVNPPSGASTGGAGQSVSSMPSSPMSTTSSAGERNNAPGFGFGGAATNSGAGQSQSQGGSSQVQAPPLFQALAAFLRTHAQLERLELLCMGDGSSSSRQQQQQQPRSRYHSASPFSNAPSPAPSYTQSYSQAQTQAYPSAYQQQGQQAYQQQQQSPYQQQQSPYQGGQPNQQGAGQGGQKAKLGYDASILGLLPSLPALRVLAITLTRDVSAGLFAWIVPRGVEALVLSGLEALRDFDSDIDGEWEGVRGFLRVSYFLLSILFIST